MATMTPQNIRMFAGLQITNETTETGICMGMYGTGGSGKTTTLAEIVYSPYGTPALLVDVEGGSSSVEHLMPLGLDIVKPSKWSEVENIRREFKRGLGGGHAYKSLIWDNVSELASMLMKSITPTQPQIQHWGQMTATMLEFIRENRDLARLEGINTLFCLWEETEKDELTGIVRKKLNLTPKFGAAFPGIVTMVGRLTVVGKARDDYVRQLSFAPSTDTDAKFRVAPTDVAAKIPLELYLRRDVHFLADFLSTVRDGTPFPADKYKAPIRQAT